MHTYTRRVQYLGQIYAHGSRGVLRLQPIQAYGMQTVQSLHSLTRRWTADGKKQTTAAAAAAAAAAAVAAAATYCRREPQYRVSITSRCRHNLPRLSDPHPAELIEVEMVVG
jgi:hypothetical protein